MSMASAMTLRFFMDLDFYRFGVNMIYVSICGSISVGKSAVFDYLKNKEYLIVNDKKIYRNRILFIEEPIADFKSFAGFNALENMMSHTLASQLVINLCMYNLYKRKWKELDSRNYDLVISERNVFSGLVFSRVLHQLGLLTKYEFTVLNSLHDHFLANLSPKPDFLLILTSSPSACLSRIRTRAREGEENLSIDYIRQLCACYNSHYLSQVYKTSNIIKIPNNQDKNTLFTAIENILMNLSNTDQLQSHDT